MGTQSNKTQNGEWIDVSVPISEGMVHWPGDPPVSIRNVAHLKKGDPATVSLLTLGTHTGTHVDAPNHFLQGETGVDQIPIEALMGPARVIELPESLEITDELLRRQDIREGERILLKTSNSPRCWETNEFVRDFAHLTLDAAEFLARAKIRTFGIDYLSVGQGENGPKVHQAMLKSGICIIEGLNLSRAAAGMYELLCLPLRIRDGDGAPARAYLRRTA